MMTVVTENVSDILLVFSIIPISKVLLGFMNTFTMKYSKEKIVRGGRN